MYGFNIMKLEDSTSATARAVRRTILSGESAHVQLNLLDRLRIQLIGIFYTEVGPEWSSGGKQESDYLHHIDLTLTGHRQVVFCGEVLDMEPGVAFWLPGNTPLERRYCEPSKVLFFKLRCEWLPGVDPLLDWEGRRPGPIAKFDSKYWHPWWHPKHKPTFNKLLQVQARILDWIAAAVPNLDEVILQHVQTHSRFKTVFNLIERKLAPNLSIEELARAYGTSLHAFSMAFARSTGMSPKAYLKRRLIQEAMQLLLNSDLRIKEVASQLGFSDEFHFSRFFRIANGLAPSQYRRAFARMA
jgi:AraC-like DNA-binding protein